MTKLIKRPAIHIRGLNIDPPLILAPMAGLTHSALRQIIRGCGGAGLLSTEMLSSKKLPTENPAISPYLIRTASETPLSYQLLVSSRTEVAPAMDALHKFRADAVDLNMGCTAPTVGRFGAGFCLMENPAEARSIVIEARKRTTLPLTAKIRLGTELNETILRSFCSMLECEGIDLISVHARLKHESFARKPRWDRLAPIKEWIAIPVIANGGIFSVEDAVNCLKVSAADGLMIGRGAAVTPWLFAAIAHEVLGVPAAVPEISLTDIYGEYVGHLTRLFRPEHRLGRLKEFTHYFSRNYDFGHQLASRVQSSASVDEARERAVEFFALNCRVMKGIAAREA